MIDTPKVIETKRIEAAVIHLTIPRAEIQSAMGPAIGEVMGAAQSQGIAVAGPVFSRHFKMDAKTFDFEVGVPVAAPIAPTGRVKRGELPAGKVARTIYRGGYEGLGAAWGEFDKWQQASGQRFSPGLWESYRTGPESGPDASKWETELSKPIATTGQQ